VLAEEVLIDARAVVVALEMRSRDEMDEVAIALEVLR
jgi:hypothetical protein